MKKKYLFTNIPKHGHIQPTIAFVRQLISRGNKVIYYSTEDYKKVIESAGGNFVPYTKKELEIMNSGLVWLNSKRKNELTVEDIIQAGFKKISDDTAIAQSLLKHSNYQDIEGVIFDSAAGWGKLIARYINVPSISSITILPFRANMLQKSPEIALKYFCMVKDCEIQKYGGYEKCAKFISRCYAKYGFNQVDSETKFNIVYTPKCLHPLLHCFSEKYQFVSLNQLYNEQPNIEKSGKPLVYISFGTIFHNNIKIYEMILNAVSKMPFRVLLSLGGRDDLNLQLPQNVTVKRFVNQMEVLNQASLFITHAGLNSVKEAIFSTVPSIAIPQALDQFLNARQIEKLNIGKTLLMDKLTSKKIQDTISDVINNPNYIENLVKLKESALAGNTFGMTTDLFEDYIRENKKEVNKN